MYKCEKGERYTRVLFYCFCVYHESVLSLRTVLYVPLLFCSEGYVGLTRVLVIHFCEVMFVFVCASARVRSASYLMEQLSVFSDSAPISPQDSMVYNLWMTLRRGKVRKGANSVVFS